ncbi:MAG TPA: HIT domain-containing protein [Candidatus Paceibacterota bacterium]
MENCIFCKIARDEVPAQKTFEDSEFVAFLDINPKAPGHTLVIPKAHYAWFLDLPDDLSDRFFRVARSVSQKLKKEKEADYIHFSIVGKDIPHAHIHLIPQKL